MDKTYDEPEIRTLQKRVVTPGADLGVTRSKIKSHYQATDETNSSPNQIK